MTEERKGLLERLKTRKTIILREPLMARFERRRHSMSPTEIEESTSIEEREFLEATKLERKLSEMQYDESLTWQQRKMANEKLKQIINMPNYPNIPKEVYENAIEQVKKAGVEKSTYEMFVEKASRELAEAKDHLRRYAETTECGWCKQKAESLAKTTEQLEALTPLAQEFSEKVGALEAEALQNLSEEITQIRAWLENATGNPAKKFHVRYIDQTTGKTVEKTIPNIEQYELYKLQREGKINIISIHSVT